MKIYIVQEYGGQWEDSWKRPVCAFEDRADAEKLRDEIIKAHKEQDKQKEKCQECKYMYEREGEKPKCFKPMAYDPEECETLDIIYDDWCGVDIRELEYVPQRAMWICPNCGLEVHKDFKKCVRCGYALARMENGNE